MLALTISLPAAAAVAAERPDLARLGGYVTLTSDYRNRGLSQSGGGAALQVGVDYQHSRGFFAGAWASNVEYPSEQPLTGGRETELDYYLGYDWRRDDWAATFTFVRYTYPGASLDYDYNELSVSVGYRDRLFYVASYTDDLLSQRLSALNQELHLSMPLAWNMELGAVLGVFDSDIRGSRYTHWNVGVSKLVRQWSIDLRFYDNDYRVSSYFGDPADDQLVLTLSYGFERR